MHDSLIALRHFLLVTEFLSVCQVSHQCALFMNYFTESQLEGNFLDFHRNIWLILCSVILCFILLKIEISVY